MGIAFFLVGLIVMFFVVPVLFSRAVYRMADDDLSAKMKIISLIPCLNVIVAERIYTGRLSINLIAKLGFICSFVIWYVLQLFVPGTSIVRIAVVLMLVFLLFMYFANVYFVFMIIRDSETKGLGACIMNALVYTWGQWYIANFLSIAVKNLERYEETFKW